MEDLETRVTRHTEQIKTLFTDVRELKAVVNSINTLAMTTHELAGNLHDLRDDVKGLRQDVDEMKLRPARRWQDLIDKLLLAALTGVAGFLISQMMGI